MFELNEIKSRLCPSPALAVSVMALVVASTGVAVGAITSADGTINACSANTGGALRVVDEAAACDATETRVTWNQRGPAGPAGGLSGAWFAPPAGTATMNARTVFVKLRSLDLPAGSYALDARSNLRLKDGVENLTSSNRGPANIRAAVADCRLRTRPADNPKAPHADVEHATAITNSATRAYKVNGEVYSAGNDFNTHTYTRRNEVPLALHTAVSLPAPTTVSLECRVDYGGREGTPDVRPSIVASASAIRALTVGNVSLAR